MNASNFDSNIERDRIYIDSSFFFERKLGYFVLIRKFLSFSWIKIIFFNNNIIFFL